MSRSFLDASIPDILAKLSIDEKILLLSAPNWWNTNEVKRLGIPAIRMSDGPNGVRGSSHFIPTPAQCLPCATALASTFDTNLIRKVGEFLASEVKLKSSVVLLAPTCNIPRSPLGGRSFESFSEDPHLSGMMASAYVNGIQSQGVSATIKHFVANDQEHERTAVESVISERALREIYLYPFMLAQIHAQPWAYMTSYGRIGGVHCSENPRLLNDILRKEWRFDGLVMSDWFGTYSVDQAIKAGLDLEMPGPPRWRTPLLVNHTLGAQKILVDDINARVHALLSFVQKLAKKNPEVVYGDGIERSKDSPETRRFCRKLTAETMVLLKNKSNLLPLRLDKVKKLAVIGPHAKASVISGGGSAALKPTYVITPFEGISNGKPEGMSIRYTVGTYADRYLPTLEALIKTEDGEPGWTCTFYKFTSKGGTEDVASYDLTETKVKLNDFIPSGLGEEWGIRLRGSITVDRDMPFEFGLAVAGRAKLFVDDRMVIDNWTKQRAGDFFYGQGTAEEKAVVELRGGQATSLMINYVNTSPPPSADDDLGKLLSQPALMRGLRLGGAEKIDEDRSIKEAAELAYNSDVAIVVCGLTSEWESEGFDRPTLDLPRRQNELITKVCRANPKTIVVIQSGSAVSMPWVADADGILQAWLSGNEAGNAIADVLFGKVNPSARLPLTLPARIEDTPAFLSFGSENGKVVYREDLFVGYKHYQARNIKPLFPFGHGLSYTTFALSDIKVQEVSAAGDAPSFEVTVSVTNTGEWIGSEVVMLFVTLPENGTTTPGLQLRGFAKANDVPPRKKRTVTIKLDKYSFSFWDTLGNAWKIVGGKYVLHIGASSDNLPHKEDIVLNSSMSWTGL